MLLNGRKEEPEIRCSRAVRDTPQTCLPGTFCCHLNLIFRAEEMNMTPEEREIIPKL